MQQDPELYMQQSRCVAHEIRNQVSVCDVYCEIIKKHLEKEDIQNDAILRALNCIQKSTKMISNSLIDLKSMDNFKQQILDLSELVLSGANLSKVYIQDKDVEIITNIKDTCNVYLDENKFLACLINLVKNGIEAIEIKGKIILSTEIRGDFVYLTISNDGKPMSTTTQKDLFNEGYTTKKTGSGLGLFICKENLAHQDTELTLVQSTSKKTEFLIKIPIILNEKI